MSLGKCNKLIAFKVLKSKSCVVVMSGLLAFRQFHFLKDNFAFLLILYRNNMLYMFTHGNFKYAMCCKVIMTDRSVNWSNF